MIFKYENFAILNERKGDCNFGTVEVNVISGIVMGIKISVIRQYVVMNESQFVTLFPQGQDIIVNAMEAEAQEQ